MSDELSNINSDDTEALNGNMPTWYNDTMPLILETEVNTAVGDATPIAQESSEADDGVRAKSFGSSSSAKLSSLQP